MGFNLLPLGFVVYTGLPTQSIGSIKKKTKPRRWTRGSPPLKRIYSSNSSSFTVSLHRFSSLNLHLHNQFSTTSRSINFFLMSSFPFAFFLLLYILLFSFEWKPNLELWEQAALVFKSTNSGKTTLYSLRKKHWFIFFSRSLLFVNLSFVVCTTSRTCDQANLSRRPYDY